MRTALRAALGCGAATAFAAPRSALARPKPPKVKIYRRNDLEFGTVASDLSFSGTVAISATTGARTLTGGLFDFGGVSNRAEFLITGVPYWPIDIDIPSTLTVRGRRTGSQMTVHDFTTSFANPLVLNYTGWAVIYVGATLDVAANQRADTYRCDLTVEAEYIHY